MITINRISGDVLGVSQYEVVLNGNVVVAAFDHNRPDDLPTLLIKSAAAVTKARGEYGDAIFSRARQGEETGC